MTAANNTNDSDRRGRSTNHCGAGGRAQLESASRRAEQGGPGSCDSRLHAAATTGKATPTVENNENTESQIEMRQRDNIF